MVQPSPPRLAVSYQSTMRRRFALFHESETFPGGMETLRPCMKIDLAGMSGNLMVFLQDHAARCNV